MAEQYRLRTDFSRLERENANDEKSPLHSRYYQAGDTIEPTEAELRAFPDRFAPMGVDPFQMSQSSPAPGDAPDAKKLNPELYSLIRRAQAGEASADEQAIVGDLLVFMEHHAQGRATADETTTIEDTLKEFGIALFV
jgi:hypothetical protein